MQDVEQERTQGEGGVKLKMPPFLFLHGIWVNLMDI